MATQPIELIEEESVEVAEATLGILDILSLNGENLANYLDDNTLMRIGQNVIRDVEIDESSRGEWRGRYEKNIDIAMQKKADKVFPWPGASNSRSPILTIASIQFNAEAYPVIVDGSNLVKGRVLGPDPDGQKRSRADRIGQHMTWQLLYRMPGWEEDTDRLLLMLPIVGCMFRKTFYDSIENANRSEIVNGLDFIINNDAKSIETAPRYTHRLHYYPYEAAEFVAAGMWRKVAVEADEGGDDDQALVEFYEQHRCEDLDGDGYPEHYVVTCTKDGEVARIVPCFGPEDVTVMSPILAKPTKLKELAEDAAMLRGIPLQVVKVTRRQYFTKYGFIPSPDGSFYDIGFGDLLENVTGLIDKLQNQMIDAAALANAGGGFVAAGMNMRGGNFSFKLGEWKRVDVPNGTALRDNFFGMPAAGPAPVSFSLLEMLYQSARDITSAQDVVAGRASPNQPATTTLALIEQASTVRKGIFKRIHRSFGQELRILRRLNRDYLDEEEYFQLNDSEQAVQVVRDDYGDEDLDVIPVSDPGQVSDMHKMMRAQAMFEAFNGDVLINQTLLRENMLVAMGARDVKAYFEVPPPQPDPKALAEVAKAETQKMDAESRRTTAQAGASEKFAGAAERLANLGLLQDAATLAAHAVEESAEEDMNEQHADPFDGQGALPGMEGAPGDGGVLPIPPGTAIGPDGGMGEGGGGFPPPGDAGAGGFSGPASSDALG
jgi:chaperonin GroES